MRVKFTAGALALALLLCSCSARTAPPQQEAPTEDAVYYNDYLGLTLTVPAEWIVNSLSDNLAPQPGLTDRPLLSQYAGGGGRMELLDIQNLAESSDSGHCRFAAYAEIFPEEVEAEQYLELFASFAQSGGADISYELQKQEQLPLSRHTAERLCLQALSSGQDDAYIEEYYIVPLGTAFIVFYLNYWPQNEASRAAAYAALDRVTLE